VELTSNGDFNGARQEYSQFHPWKTIKETGADKTITATVNKTHDLLKKQQSKPLWKKIL